MATLEERVSALERLAEREARLRASLDEDVSTLTVAMRAQQRSIQALHDTQVEQGITLARIDKTVESHSTALARHEVSLSSAHDKLDRIVKILGQLIEREGEAGGGESVG